MTSQENDGTSCRNLCANGCGSFAPDEKLNYCDNCFDVLLAEEQAATIAAAKRPEAAYSNTTNPGENWVRAELSTVTLEECISMIRRNERARSRKMEGSLSLLSFSELLDIVRRNDQGEMDNMESSSTVPPPPLVISFGSDEGSRSEEVNGSGKVELARVVRCFVCGKKFGLMKFECKYCGGFFCIDHHISEKHRCSYDFKALGREALAKANPRIKTDKLKRI